MTVPPIDPSETNDANADYDKVLRFVWASTRVDRCITAREVFLAFEPNGRSGNREYLSGSVYDTLIDLTQRQRLLALEVVPLAEGEGEGTQELLSLSGKGLEVATLRYSQPVKPILYTGRRI